MKLKLSVAVFVILLVCLIGIGIERDQENEITDKVHKIGGTIHEIRGGHLFEEDPFPFWEHGKGVTVYRFTYKKNGTLHTGWALFGGWRTDWRMGK